MSIKDFRELGYLMEVNRRFLNPLGFSLASTIDTETGNEVIEFVFDCREDKEGVMFDEFSETEKENAERIQEEWNERTEIREKAYGFSVQPLDVSLVQAGEYKWEHSQNEL